jgi:serine/threonine-protein kinase
VRSSVPAAERGYDVITELGRGAMGVVQLVHLQGKGKGETGALRVMKRLRPSLAREQKFVKMFLAEARLAARLNHPNVVQAYDVGFDGESYFIAMEYVDGHSVEAVVNKAKAQGGEFPLRLYIYTLIQTLGGLHHAHKLTDFEGNALNLVHRDATPQNILVTYDGQVKIVDFGIAKAADSDDETRTGMLKGKCGYMAPEQFTSTELTCRADVYTVGVQLWQALTGDRLWGAMTDGEILLATAQGHVRKPSTVKRVPKGLEKICMRALAFDASRRFATALEFRAALEEYVHQHGIATSAKELGQYISRQFSRERKERHDEIKERLQNPQALASVEPLVDATVSPPSSSPLPPIVRRLPTWIVVSTVASLVGLIVIVVAAMRFTAVRATEAMGATASARAGVQEARSPVTKLIIRATPQQAAIFFDDAPLEGNPAFQTVPRDGASHAVRVEAPGYVTKRSRVVLDSTSVIADVDLDQARAQSPPPPATPHAAAVATAVPVPEHTPPPPSPPPPPRPHADGDSNPRRKVLDTSDPWAP